MLLRLTYVRRTELNLASALFKRILEESDFDTWALLRRHYLPKEYTVLFDTIDRHITLYHNLPTINDLKLSIRDQKTLNKVYALEALEIDADPDQLLEYLKNEYAQKEALTQLHQYVENSIAFETAEETVQSIYDIASTIESKVELDLGPDSMQKINLFESEDEIASLVTLGLNSEFDDRVRFKNIDYIMIGGRRGAGKSIICANMANNVLEQGKSVLYYTIEMNARETLQRTCAIATQIPHNKIKYRDLDNQEWLKVVEWWAQRFQNPEKYIDYYLEHRDFDKFHSLITSEPLSEVRIDVVYNPSLTLSQLRADAISKKKKLKNLGLVIVDYVNQMKLFNSVSDQYDWKEQINVSKGLKALAQELETPFVSPYQIDATGEARFSKGILDSADAAFTVSPGPDYIEFKCSKMRGDEMIDFISKTNWSTLTIGPENASIDNHEDEQITKEKRKTTFKGVYDE